MTHSAIYVGTVAHRRFFPVRHRFRYGVYYLWLDLSELAALDRTVRGFGYNRAAPFAFHDRDHGPHDGSALRPWFEGYLRAQGIDLEGGPVRILTIPRVFGYAFNPISVWCGYGPGDDLRAVLYEVTNTFGQHHAYLGGVEGADVRHEFHKELFVSPFIDMDARYEFRLRGPGARVSLTVRETLATGHVLDASLVAGRRPLDARGLWRVFSMHPMMGLKVIGGIHWEAWSLWRKGAPFRRHGPPPVHGVTVVTPSETTPVP